MRSSRIGTRRMIRKLLDAVAANGTRAWCLEGPFPAEELHRIHPTVLDRIQQLR